MKKGKTKNSPGDADELFYAQCEAASTFSIAICARDSGSDTRCGWGCGRVLKKVIIATPATMMADAARVMSVICSPFNAQPKNTATTGFTYAYVETLAGVLT